MTKTHIYRDEDGTAYINDPDGLTRVFAYFVEEEWQTGLAWKLERQPIGGGEAHELEILGWYASENEAIQALEEL